MKVRVIYLLLSVVMSLKIATGQYHSIFGSKNTQWNYISLYCDAGFVESYIHEKDTMINGMEYHKINDWGLLRETDLNSKLWYRDFNNEEEVLLIDMTLNIGDSFFINSKEFIVDSIYFDNNLKVIEFNYIPPNCGFYERLKFKEGIGPNLSYNFSLSANEDNSKLLRCHTKDSITINYLEDYGFGTNCSSDLVSIKKFENLNFQLFPNPFSKELIIRTIDNKQKTIEMYSLNGVKVLEQLTNELITTINTENLQGGLYILRINDMNNLFNIKVVKEK